MAQHLAEITGKRFGMLVVQKRSPTRYNYWLCVCDCGKVRVIRGDSLRQGRSQSCGCDRDAKSLQRRHATKGKPKPKRKKRYRVKARRKERLKEMLARQKLESP